VLLRRIEADGFLSFGDHIGLDIDPGLTVITGPNGSGKSNLGRCLDLGRIVIDRAQDGSVPGRLDLYEDAGHEGRDSFTVRLSIDLDLEWERDLVRAFVCACFSHGSLSIAHHSPSDDAEVRASLVKESLAPLWSGSLVVHRPAISTLPVSAAWEFAVDQDVWHVDLADNRSQIIPGAAEAIPKNVSYGGFQRWLQPLGMQKHGKIDFRAALQSATGATDFSAEYRGKGMTDSLQELTSALQVDPDSNAYGFDQVLSAVLRR
jgi:hypothetical protein